MSLFDYGLLMEDENCRSDLGELFLCFNPQMECGDWYYWEINQYISDDLSDEDYLDYQIGITFGEGNVLHFNCESPDECLLEWIQ